MGAIHEITLPAVIGVLEDEGAAVLLLGGGVLIQALGLPEAVKGGKRDLPWLNVAWGASKPNLEGSYSWLNSSPSFGTLSM